MKPGYLKVSLATGLLTIIICLNGCGKKSGEKKTVLTFLSPGANTPPITTSGPPGSGPGQEPLEQFIVD